MNEQNQRDSIMSMARGAFEERVDYEMDKVIQNILDPNTKATAKRKITLTIELTPDDERRTIGVQVTAKSTLAATNPVATPEDTEHGESWSAASEAIFKKYNELLDTMIPDEPEPILSPHQPGDGGILTMPLRDNVPEPPTDDWQLTTCPVCGAECWQTDTARRILTLEPDVRTACTACALKGLGK